ncbi:MAG: hypothetical protein KatS3mg117_3442 [Geminicoccaceae bacterium]|jgi:hypothetical protein|nr:MAG: hypothetical protein KatS3mg117_3442 [Geminicoccaceae bacterium]
MVRHSILKRAVCSAAILGAFALAGCRSAAEIEQAAAEARRTSCLEAGFVEGTDAYRLCLLLQETQERIVRLERRIDLLDSEVSRIWSWGTLRRWP